MDDHAKLEHGLGRKTIRMNINPSQVRAGSCGFGACGGVGEFLGKHAQPVFAYKEHIKRSHWSESLPVMIGCL